MPDEEIRYRLVAPAWADDAAYAPTDAQRRVIEHARRALLVLGGPGTGKTSTIAAAAAARINEGGRPLVLCFSRRDAVRMGDEIARRTRQTVAAPLAMTIHAFCLSLQRRFAAFESGPRLLTAPEQEYRLRELVAGGGRRAWPESLRMAVGTRGFSVALRSFLARARQLGLDPSDVVEAGDVLARPDWSAAGEYFEGYLDVLDSEGALDYAELVHRSRILLGEPDVAAALRDEITAVYVDELTELDPAQLGLVRQLVPVGGHVVACGDPDQAVFGFRGAHPRILQEYLRLFATPGDLRGSPESAVGIEVLQRGFRLPPALRDAAAAVAGRIALPGISGSVLQRHRNLQATDTDGDVRIRFFDSGVEEASFIAQELRRAHLIEGVPWGEMAVIVRSARLMIPVLRRALGAANVPVAVAGDEIPLAAELAVRPLLLALGVACDRVGLDGDVAERLLVSPLAGLDSITLRALGRALRAADREFVEGGVPRASSQLLAEALQDPAVFGELPPDVVPDDALRLVSVLASARRLVESGASAAEVLWHLWEGTDWPARLVDESAVGGARGRRADRDLDAVCALFDAAEKADAIAGPRGVLAFLEEISSQDIPADTLAESAVRPEAVRLLTAFRAKGHQWRRVFVAGVQEGVWPDFRSPDLLLATDCLPDGPFEMDRSATIAAGRRLFYLAVSRSSGDVIVTAVRGTDGEADQPSRFIGELQVPPEEPSRFPRPALSLTELVVTLRDAITDPLASPELRRAAARRLARLSELGEPAADPRSWWGTAPVSSSGAPARVPRQDDDGPIRLSGSQLESLLGCPRQHFLSRQAKADPPRNSAATLGSVIHSLASHAISDDLDQDELTEHLDSVWDRIPFDAAWLSMSEREEADAALRRLLVWSQANGYREVAGVEVPFTARLEVAGAEVLLTGQVDRLEHDGEGGLRIVDFKTGRSLPTRAAVARQDQLGVYQLAVQLGAFEQVAPGVRRAGGGELVYLRHSDRNPDYPRTFDQPSLSDEPHPALSGPRAAPTWVHERLTEAVRIVRDGSYPATPGEDVCRWCPFTASCPARGGEQVVR